MLFVSEKFRAKNIFDNLLQKVILFHVQRTLIFFLHPLLFMRTSKKQNLIAFVVAKKLFALDDIP